MQLYSTSSDSFRVILEFQLAWVLNFCLWQKTWEIQIFFKNGPHLPTAPGAFLTRTSKNVFLSREIEPLVLNM